MGEGIKGVGVDVWFKQNSGDRVSTHGANAFTLVNDAVETGGAKCMEAIESDGVLRGHVFEAYGTGVIFERGGEGVHKELDA